MVDLFNQPSADPFFVGHDVSWQHGEHYRTARVLAVEPDRVYLDGMKSRYWMKKATILAAIGRERTEYQSLW